jgi:putative ABC transport system permease protein
VNASLLSLAAALDNLGANPLRTLLSTLGVIIGVASLVAILALGDGLERFGREQISRTTDLQSIMVQPRLFDNQGGVRVWREEIPTLTQADAADLRSRLVGRADVALFLLASARASVPGDTARRAVLVVATGPEAASQLRDGLAVGRYLTEDDVASDAAVVVVEPSVGEWYGAAPETLPGRRLELDGVAHEIVGVVADEGGSAAQVQVPLSGATRGELERRDRVAALAVRAQRVEEVEAVGDAVESWIGSRFGDTGSFTVQSNKAMAAQARQGMLVFKLVMGAIAGISLLVGGIGIMNILLASVAERTREIGIRKAAGARQWHVLLQFLAESVAITGIGSVLGVMVGLVGAFAVTAGIRRLTEVPIYAAFTWQSVAVAALAALLVGLVFGTYPARRAARLSPIEAIRHE